MNTISAPRRLPVAVPAAIAVAWVVAFAAHAAGHAAALHHDAILGHGPPAPGAVAVFAGAWVVMVAAMMLPSAIPLMRLFAAASAHQPRPGRGMAAFIAGYLAIWALFGWLALGFDALVHNLVASVSWLDARPWLVGAYTLALAGAFQFSSLKERCLSMCRHPAAYLLRHYRRGSRGAFTLGWGHGLFCLGCCWALMLVMFAAGVADLRWMAALGALMAYEKIGRYGAGVASVAGVTLLACAVLLAAHPAWLPSVVSAA
jgi:predicted metal-binding membrane protein